MDATSAACSAERRMLVSARSELRTASSARRTSDRAWICTEISDCFDDSSAASRSRTSARRCPPSKTGCEALTEKRQLPRGEKAPEGVTACGSNEADTVGNQSLRL